jgi:CheY-like chemotaxis protein
VKTRPPRVLVAQSDAVERRLVTGYVAQFGCQTSESRSGQEALESLLTSPADLLLLDVQLPDMDGIDVTRVLRSQPKTASLPIILMTSRLDRHLLAFGIQSGATDVLSKPLDLSSMIARVWDVLQHDGFIPPQDNEALAEALKAASKARAHSSGVRRLAATS